MKNSRTSQQLKSYVLFLVPELCEYSPRTFGAVLMTMTDELRQKHTLLDGRNNCCHHERRQTKLNEPFWWTSIFSRQTGSVVFVNPLECEGNYMPRQKKIWSWYMAVYVWGVIFGTASGPTQCPPHCTKCNSAAVNGQCTNQRTVMCPVEGFGKLQRQNGTTFVWSPFSDPSCSQCKLETFKSS